MDAILDTLPNECLAVRVTLVHRAVTNIYNRALRPVGLRITQMFILVLASREPNIRPSQLCEKLQLDPSTLSRNLDRMQKKNWLQVTGNPRTQHISILPLGKELLQNAIPLWREAQEDAQKLLEQGGVEEIRRISESLWKYQT